MDGSLSHEYHFGASLFPHGLLSLFILLDYFVFFCMRELIMSEEEERELSRTGIPMPRLFLEPQSLSSKKDRERRSMTYIPPAPRPHHQVRSAPSQTRLLHSRYRDRSDLDNSFHLLFASPGTSHRNFFREYFEIQERIGFGSFGDVYRVKEKATGKEFALKKSRKTFSGERDRLRQLNEVRRVVDLPSSSHLVMLENAWEENGHLYLQLELCSKSVTQHIEDDNCLSEIEVWEVLIDMLKALDHLHKNKLVHMDVKPDNIFLSYSKPLNYKLGDFGIVVSQGDVGDVTEGDSRYIAPEVLQGIVSTKADVFSLGLTILEIACHVDLPKGGDLWHKLRSGMLPDPCDQSLYKSLRNVITRMLEPDPDKRPEVTEILEFVEVQHWNYRRKLRYWGAFVSEKKQTPSMDLNRTTLDSYIDPSPSLALNDNSFSDDDECRVSASSPIFASTPISHANTESKSSGRSVRNHGGALDPLHRTMGSPASRNLLKEFEAVSD